jgi:hypothetical protein
MQPPEKTAVQTAAEKGATSPPLRPQPHGGALLAGGLPGNRGGPGAPPSVVRERARTAFHQRIPVLEQIADGQLTVAIRQRCPGCGHEPTPAATEVIAREVRPADQVAAMRELGRVGMGERISVEDVRIRLTETVTTIREVLPPTLAEAVIDRLDPIWRGTRQ